MHSVSDILAQVTMYALQITSINQEDVSLNLVNKNLPNSPLKDEITKLLGMKEFCYLKDFVNKTKHISLVFSEYTANLENLDKQKNGMKFIAFSYKPRGSSRPRSYPEKWHSIFLVELEKLSFQYVKIGQEINNCLKNKT